MGWASGRHWALISQLDYYNMLYMIAIASWKHSSTSSNNRYLSCSCIIVTLHAALAANWFPCAIQVLVVTYKALRGIGPGYLSGNLSPDVTGCAQAAWVHFNGAFIASLWVWESIDSPRILEGPYNLALLPNLGALYLSSPFKVFIGVIVFNLGCHVLPCVFF